MNTMGYHMIKLKKMDLKFDPKDLFLDGYDYSVWSEIKETLADKKESEEFTTDVTFRR